ncbi:MAG TPA: hypothetical protein VGG46_08925 [Terriglobales bacterium]|jgi:hypothetical protein
MSEVETEITSAELDAVYAAQQKAEQELAEKNEAEGKLREEIAETKLRDLFSDARKESGFAFHMSTPELMKLVRSEPNFLVNAEEKSFFIDGSRVELPDMLRAFAARHRWSREATAAERSAWRGQKETGIRSKADLKTTSEKSSYVSRFGADAYASLPANTPIDDSKIQYLTLEEFGKLPTKQKVRFVAKHGSAAVENLRFNKR